jgi:PTS system mannose-specific IIA component
MPRRYTEEKPWESFWKAIWSSRSFSLNKVRSIRLLIAHLTAGNRVQRKSSVSMIGCVILTHGDLCFALKDTLEGIMGKQEGLSAISNCGMGKEELFLALDKRVNQKADGDGIVVFVDMFGTSCWQIARKVVEKTDKNEQKSALITGVNLPMLVKFFSLRASLPLEELVPLVKQEGEKGIRTGS